MKLDDFKGTVSGGSGLALPTLFKVILPPIGGHDPQDLNLICKGVNLPGRQITSTDYQVGTPVTKIANGFACPDVTLTFYVLNNHKITNYFDLWQREAHDQENYVVGYYDDYAKPVEIHQLQKGTGFSLFKKQIGFLEQVPRSIRERIDDALDLGIPQIDIGNGQIDISAGSSAPAVRKVKLHGAYPTSVNDIQLGNDQNDQITELTVQLSYRDWSDEGADAVNDNLGDTVLGGIIGLFT